MSYLKDNFLFENETAVKLYETYAKDMPIFGYHCQTSRLFNLLFLCFKFRNCPKRKKDKAVTAKNRSGVS